MLLIYEFSASENPATLSKALWQHNIGHRIIHNEGGDQLWLLNPVQSHAAMALLQQWLSDPHADISVSAQDVKRSYIGRFVQQWHETPMTYVFLMLSVLLSMATGLGSYLDTLEWFTIASFTIEGNQIYFSSLGAALAGGEYWRLLTPAFLHFSAAHLLFNSLWVWQVGRKLERQLGAWVWLIFTLIVSVASNLGQYLVNDYPLFGGLSGLVYGLVSFAFLMPILIKGWPTIIDKPLMVLFSIWLVAGYSDIFAVIGLGKIANEAHLVGLVSGMVLAFVYSIALKVRKS